MQRRRHLRGRRPGRAGPAIVSANEALSGDVIRFDDAALDRTREYRSTAKALFAVTAAVSAAGATALEGTRCTLDCAMAERAATGAIGFATARDPMN